jgi:hypothetical protein
VLEATALLRTRWLSAAELTEACLAAIDQRNGGPPTFDGAPQAINAWVRLYPELAREHAREADDRLAREGEEAPLLCGVPIALKDLYAVEGLPLTASSRVLEDHIATHPAGVWARLRGQGIVLVGHTHMHECAAGGTTDQVGNPWALDRVAGGSSGGRRRRDRCPDGAGGARHRHVRVAADPFRVLRDQCDQADARAAADRRDHPPCANPRPSGADGPDGRRLRGPACRDVARRA